MIRRPIVASIVSAVLGSLCIASAAEARTTGFVAQDARVTCLYVSGSGAPARLRCDTKRDANAPARPESCNLDWGRAF